MVSAPRPYVAPAPVETRAAPAPVLPTVTWQRATRVELGSAPLLVWIGDGTRPDEVTRERLIFGVPKTSLGAHAFRRLRIPAADAAKDPRLAAWAGLTGPTLVAISADGAKSTPIPAESMAPRPVWVAMKEVAAANFSDDLETMVAAARQNLEETERLEAERRELRLSQLAETDRQARLAAVVARMTELESQLLTLWTLHPRKSA